MRAEFERRDAERAAREAEAAAQMEEFEEEAYKVLGRKDSSSRNEGNKPGSSNPFDDGPSMDD